MNWRDLMTAPAEPYPQNPHNSGDRGSSEDIGDIGDIGDRGLSPWPDTAARPADWHGFTLADLRTAAGEDWSKAQDNPAVLAALAGGMRTQAQRDGGEVPAHYTQACACDTCGPVWLWKGAPARLIACPWCLTRPKGAPIPRPRIG